MPGRGPWGVFFGQAVHRASGRPYRVLVDEAAEAQGPYRSVLVDFFDLQLANHALAEQAVSDPTRVIAAADAALSESHPDANLHARLTHLPDDRAVDVPSLREVHVDTLVRVRGVVGNASEVAGKVVAAWFQCQICKAFTLVEQPEPGEITEPLECTGGEHKKTAFKCVLNDGQRRSRLVDMQVFQLQEPPDMVRGTRTPESKTCRVFGDLCGVAAPGDRVTVNGILRANLKQGKRGKSAILEYHLEVLSIEREQSTYEEIPTTPEEEARFRELAASGEAPRMCTDSFAPTIHGGRTIKLGLALQLFGGVSKHLDDGRRIRGDIHVALLGDPGQGKSVLLKRAAALSPRGFFADSTTTTVPGLVGGVERLNQGFGDTWVYQAGLITMAHRGLLALDEADKAEAALMNAMLMPMAQQIASLNKMGARNLHLPAETAVLIGANFKDGRYDVHEPIAAQVNFTPPLIDRLDLFFTLRDHADEDLDRAKVSAMLKAHLHGAVKAAKAAGHDVKVDAERLETIERAVAPPLSTEELRKYVAFARRTVTPILDETTMARINEKYGLVRKRKSNSDLAPVGESPRYVDTLVRLAEAAAKMRLSPLVEEEDIELAYEVWKEGVEQHTLTASGERDADRLSSIGSADQRTRIKTLRRLIEEMGEERAPDLPSQEEIVREALNRGFEREFVLSTIRRLVDNGTLVERRGGWTTSNVLAKLKLNS